LLDPSSEKFSAVQNFFDNTVRPSLADLNFRNIEIGRNEAQHPFINMEIFERLHFADVAIADLTGLRPNNFLEAGYAFGRPKPVILTAMDGTPPPFDTQAVPIFFWAQTEPDVGRRRKFLEHWRLYVGRAPLVRPRELG
jgi:nucleoside 2-deoxyribosyltransferase